MHNQNTKHCQNWQKFQGEANAAILKHVLHSKEVFMKHGMQRLDKSFWNANFPWENLF